jgi:hypothetical protein
LGTELYRYTKVDVNSNLDNLNFFEKLRAMYQNWFVDTGRSEIQKAKNEEEVSEEMIKMQANLLDFIHKATEKIRTGDRFSVTMDIASEFDPVIDQVLTGSSLCRFYDIKVLSRPKPDIKIPYKIRIRLTAR